MKVLLLILSALVVSCNSQSHEAGKIQNNSEVQVNTDTTVMRARLNLNDKAFYFYFDKYLQTHPPFLLEKNNEIKIVHDKPVLMIDAKTQLPDIIFPGDYITIQDSMGIILLKAQKDIHRNNDLQFFTSLRKSEKSNFFEEVQFYLDSKLYR